MTSPSTVISVSKVSKAYRIWDNPAARLSAPLFETTAKLLPAKSTLAQSFHARAASSYRDFWALKDINFEVRRGESIGIIGRNGSGKSTLLQIIAGTLQPTKGAVTVNGRVAALLELGSGFNPEFTGRENVMLNGAILGFTGAQMEERYDQIAAFADIGDYINQPVKTYSSGMMIRLAFAVAVSAQPDVLIVDEALSVGDVFFQQKCFKRVHEMLEAGVSLLFVSHDPGAVQNLCDHAILLDQGEVVHHGPPEECVSRYYARNGARPFSNKVDNNATKPLPSRLELQSSRLVQHNLVPKARARHGTRELEIIAAQVVNPAGEITLQSYMMQALRVEVLVRAHCPIAHPSCGLHFYDRMNNLVYGAGNVQLGVHIPAFEAGSTALIAFTITMSVQPGPYTFNIAMGEPDPADINLGYFYDVCEGLGPIEIIPPAVGAWPFYGIASLPMTMEILYE